MCLGYGLQKDRGPFYSGLVANSRSDFFKSALFALKILRDSTVWITFGVRLLSDTSIFSKVEGF